MTYVFEFAGFVLVDYMCLVCLVIYKSYVEIDTRVLCCTVVEYIVRLLSAVAFSVHVSINLLIFVTFWFLLVVRF